MLLSAGLLGVGAALVITIPFSPMLFMGEEWGASTPWQFFTSYPDPALGDAVREGRRSEFGDHGWDAEDVPDPQDPATRDRSVLRWDEPASGDHARLLDWYRALIALRRAEPDLRADDLREVRVEHGDTWVAVHRGAFTTVVNLAPTPADLPAPGTPVLSWGDVTPTESGVRLGPDAVAVVRSA